MELNEVLIKLYDEACELLKDRWVYMESKKVIYDNELVACIPNTEYYDCIYDYTCNYSTLNFIRRYKKKLNFENLNWDLMTLDENKKIFNKNFRYPFKSNRIGFYYNSKKFIDYSIAYVEGTYLKSRNIGNDSIRDVANIIVPIYRLDKLNSSKIKNGLVLNLWLENEFVPKNTQFVNEYYYILQEMKNKSITIKTKLINIEELKRETINYKLRKPEEEKDKQKEQEEIERLKRIDEERKEAIRLEEARKKELERIEKDRLNMESDILYSDKLRINIEPYDSQILTDLNRGHWEAKNHKEYVYRNPLKDIIKDGLVGIDFGTKSTVVVYQKDNTDIIPMRIGTNKLSDEIKSNHFENPTTMEFFNIENFLKDYNKTLGRPKTKWEDVVVSHSAFNNLLVGSNEDFYSYFTDLKQWSSNKERKVIIKDKSNKIYDLKPFLELNDDDFNPIEIYAYYLGLYINNMINGIYLNYTLSFPVTYEKEIRDKVLESFSKGIKKSLPNEVLEDEESMKKFSVVSGATEPASYAISALTEYGFDPVDDEKVFYGVFDFGGGTTDFDFGIFREANQKGERKFDYVIEHFGAEGDRYLGGENLLEILAFETFKNNADYLRKNKISFICPPECRNFGGSELIINTSKEARRNTINVMNKLRPLWENPENNDENFSKGIINTNLYQNDGKLTTIGELKINIEYLQNVLEKRIEKGIKNFFECLRKSFENSNTSNVEKINIFLAGNSSKSKIVTNLFEKYIEIENRKIIGLNDDKIVADKDYEVALTLENNFFEIFPPLGTNEAYKKMESLGIEFDRNDLNRPTGKTGVAFGLIEGRVGGKIKVVNHNNEEDGQVKFKYYVGDSKKKKFKPLLTPESNYCEWVEFIDAMDEVIEIYFSNSPEASSRNMSISETTKIKITLEETFDYEDVMVYIRTIKPTVIEYVVAKEVDGGIDLMSEVKEINLG